MRHSKLILYAVIMICFGCNRTYHPPQKNNKEDSLKKSLLCFFPTHKVDSLYNNSKLNFFSLQCEDTVDFVEKKDTILTFGMLELRLVAYHWKHDTLDLYYCYVYKDKIQHHSKDIKNFFISALRYVKPYEKPIEAISSYEGMLYRIYKNPNRIVNPLQADVISYIKKNQKQINPWLEKIAIENGVLKK